MKAFVTGAMGFLGRHVVQRLNAEHADVVVYDRKDIAEMPIGFTFAAYYRGDVLDSARLTEAMTKAKPDVVFHLAALADVRSALKMPRQQLEQNLVATFNVLEAMKAAQVPRIMFTSTAVVYGDTQTEQIDERALSTYRGMKFQFKDQRAGFPQQTSIYGAMKLASESLIAAYCEGYGLSADIFRFVSLTGPGYRHGNLMDFYQRLKSGPAQLQLMGAPTQAKYYCAVEDAVNGMMLAFAQHHGGAEIFNVSHGVPNTIQDSIEAVVEVLGIPMPAIQGGESWPGDLPQLVLDCAKLRRLGWTPQIDIKASMRDTVRDLIGRDDSQTVTR